MDDIAQKLAELKARAQDFSWNSSTTPEFSTWFAELRSALRLVDSELERSLDSISFSPPVVGPLVSEHAWRDSFRNGIDQSALLIDKATASIAEFSRIPNPAKAERGLQESMQVFIVHGHDHEAKEAVARLFEKLTFDTTILHERANAGAALMEKLEFNSDVAFAVVLLTPDDVGKARDDEQVNPRARQNVIFEFGYFVGRLGRKRVCAIVRDRVELPSDLLGITYIRYDPAGHWRFDIIKELKALGYDVDANIAV